MPAAARRPRLTAEQIAAALPQMRVELVLTAHPTEAKRTIVLEHHRNLYLLLVKRENRMWTPYEQRAIREEIKTLLSLLWRTGEIFLHKPDVAAERRNIMHYLYTVFPEVLPGLDQRLRQAWEHLGFDAGAAAPARESAALQRQHLGRRRPRRPSAGHRGGDPSDARRPAAARIAAAAASAGGRWRGSAACRIVCNRRRRRCVDRVRQMAADLGAARPAGDRPGAGRNLAAAGRPDAGAAAAGGRLPRRRTAVARGRTRYRASRRIDRRSPRSCTTRWWRSARGAWPTMRSGR